MDDNGASFNQKLEFIGVVVLDLDEHVDLVIQGGLDLLRICHGLVVTVVPLEVEGVPFQLILGIVSLLLLVGEALVRLQLLLVHVALVVAARRAAMRLPVAHTDPAEFVPARQARHMVTPLVLLNGLVTAWTLLGIRRYPLDIFTLGTCLFQPFVVDLTRAWQMGQLATLETKDSATLPAVDLIDIAMACLLKEVVAAGLRTPLDILVVVRELLAQLLPIQLFHLGNLRQ